MTTKKQLTCLISQSACGRITGEPVCPKCGLDVGARYVSEDAGLLAVSKAEARYWQSHARDLQEQINKPAPPPKKTRSVPRTANLIEKPAPSVKRAATVRPPAPASQTKLNPQAAWPFPVSNKP